jgi:hypothetical protein
LKTVVAVAIALAMVIFLPNSAGADPVPVNLEYSSNNTYQPYENAVAKFTGQVDYRSDTFAWSLKLQPSTQKVIYGDMKCMTTIAGINGYSDFYPDIPPDYLLHSSVHVERNKLYRFRSSCGFNVLTDTGMQPGSVDTAVDFTVRD